MPTYEYECRACSHKCEVFQGITEGARRKCPKCGRLKLRRLIGTGGGIIFKGSGFYGTDYRSSSYKEAKKKDTQSGTSAKTDKSGSKSDKSSGSGASKSGGGSPGSKDSKDSKDSRGSKRSEGSG